MRTGVELWVAQIAALREWRAAAEIKGYLEHAGLNVEDFWRPWEAEADSFERVGELVYGVFEKWSRKGRIFAWRGLTDARWPLHSSLYRRLSWTSTAAKAPTESALSSAEHRVLIELHRWGLHMAEYGRLSALSQLAVLQHYGAPTRLVDVTFNPWIGLWFAVEQKWQDGEALGETDARLFAIDVTDRLINENESLRRWEDSLYRPWSESSGVIPTTEAERVALEEWPFRVLAWRPPHFLPRLAAQNGGFLFGGVPSTGKLVWPRTTLRADRNWGIDEVRRATSLPLRVHKLEAGAGGPSSDAVYTIRIKQDAVPGIRKRLQDLFGYRHSTLYRDYTGFARFGAPWLKSEASPPRP